MIVNALQKLKSFGFEPKNILDIGANKGKWTLEIKKKVFPKAEYTLIEAIDYEELEKLRVKHDNINYKNIPYYNYFSNYRIIKCCQSN